MTSRIIARLSAVLVALAIGVAGLSSYSYAGADAPAATATSAARAQPTRVPTAVPTLVPTQADPDTLYAETRLKTDPFIRTELYFGSERPNLPEVSDTEFKQFLDEQVTPRFPDGLTVLKGFGQFRESDGQIVQESSFVLILLYPREALRESSAKVEEIRTLYKARFGQESVLRVDDPRPVRVSF